MATYRTGRSWGVTIVREGHTDRDPAADSSITTPDQLVAVVVDGDQALAERICRVLNADTNPDCPWSVDCEGDGCSRCGWRRP